MASYSFATDPTTADDVAHGYYVGDDWTNTVSGELFRCLYAVTGDAFWYSPTHSSGATPPVFSQDTDGLVPGPSAAEIAADKVLRADGTWVVQSGGGGGPYAKARASVSATRTSTHATPLVINFDTVDFDTASAVTTGAGWKFTAPNTSTYKVSATVLVDRVAWGVNTVNWIALRKNGTIVCYLHYDQQDNSVGRTEYIHLHGSTTIALTATDYIDIVWQQNSGSNKDILGDVTLTYIDIEELP